MNFVPLAFKMLHRSFQGIGCKVHRFKHVKSNFKMLPCSKVFQFHYCAYGPCAHTSMGLAGTKDSTRSYCTTVANGVNSGESLSLKHLKDLTVDPFGSLHVCSTRNNVNITPTNPQLYPEMNKLNVFSSSSDTGSQSDDDTALEISLSCEGKKVVVDVNTVQPDVADRWACFEVPIKFDLNLDAKDTAGISVSRVESGKIDISSERGYCHLMSVKCGELKLTKQEGDVISSNLLQGNVDISILNGIFSTDKLQGQTMKININTGRVFVRTLYGDSAAFTIGEGDLLIKNCHGSSRVEAHRGNVNIESLDGDASVKVHKGDIHVHVTRHQNVNLETENGSVNLTLDPSLETSLQVIAENISVSENLNIMDKEEQGGKMTGFVGKSSERKIQVKGTSVNIRTQDWLSALNLR